VPPPTGYRRSTATDSRSRTTEPRRPRLRSAVVVCLTLLALPACGGDDLVLPSAGEPSVIEVVDGDLQVDTVGRSLPESLIVKVEDPEGREVEGVEVVFVAPGGGTLAPNDTVVTGADGRAAIQYTLPTASGPQTIEARATPVTPTTSLTATFSVIAEPEQAVTLLLLGGDKQEAELQAALPESLAVRAVDRFGNGVAGVNVSWSVSDGSVSPDVVATGADGRAAAQLTLGSRPGVYRTSADAPGLQGSPISFEVTGIAPPSPQLALATQPSGTAQAGIPFERQPVVQLVDALGTPLAQADVAVTVQIAEGGGSLDGRTTVRSDEQGRVTFTDLAIRGRPGERTLLFAAVDFTPATSDEIRVRVGPAAAGRSSASVEDGTAGRATTISIRLEDEFGTAVEDGADQVRVTVEGANQATASVSDRGEGSYSASYTPVLAGADQITVEVNGTALRESPLSSQVVPGPSSPSTTTAFFARQAIFFLVVDVTVRDAQGNLVRRGGDKVEVQLNGGLPLRLRDNGDGTYSDSFGAGLGSVTAVVLLNGVPIEGSPFRI
jgi:hypothetical protein